MWGQCIPYDHKKAEVHSEPAMSLPAASFTGFSAFCHIILPNSPEEIQRLERSLFSCLGCSKHKGGSYHLLLFPKTNISAFFEGGCGKKPPPLLRQQSHTFFPVSSLFAQAPRPPQCLSEQWEPQALKLCRALRSYPNPGWGLIGGVMSYSAWEEH